MLDLSFRLQRVGSDFDRELDLEGTRPRWTGCRINGTCRKTFYNMFVAHGIHLHLAKLLFVAVHVLYSVLVQIDLRCRHPKILAPHRHRDFHLTDICMFEY